MRRASCPFPSFPKQEASQSGCSACSGQYSASPSTGRVHAGVHDQNDVCDGLRLAVLDIEQELGRAIAPGDVDGGKDGLPAQEANRRVEQG
jgi:hypothetical protein